ncbi:aldo/keto reductase [Cognatishimia maritima]|uniref:D-threo-aldose 1-dehydrogenase n=1 Tax=Cognatishimia maritima TaxID=870908 RepID=A0A1M5QL01_9RHOB|nr:aldo/keto reductase [Cognatishimia maritima]SHH14734.1 D-threo-aldose 1-dehydrogenase [Cognatishimia maritima]
MLNAAHRLSFGTSGLGGLYKPLAPGEAEAVLTAAWDSGTRYFDTAPHYGNGAAEGLLGNFLRDREGWVLSTKVGRVLTPDPNPPAVINGFHSSWPFKQEFDFSYDGIMRSVEDSFQRLGLNRIDILYVHDIGEPAAGTDTPEHRAALLDSGQKALEQLKADGTVAAVGLGVNRVETCNDLIGQMHIDLILLAGRYTLLDGSAREGLLNKLAAHDIRLVIGGVFNSGILATGPVDGAHFNYAPASPEILERTSAIKAICDSHDVPLAAAALQYPDRHPLVASTLIGTSKAASWLRNVDQFNRAIPEALWADLASAGFIEPQP